MDKFDVRRRILAQTVLTALDFGTGRPFSDATEEEIVSYDQTDEGN